MAEHKIILASVAQGSEAGVASALAEVLAAPESQMQKVARSAPIVLLSGLVPEQATAVLEAMDPVKQSGGGLAISAAAAESMPQVSWPEPPKLAGRGIETYRPDYVPPGPPVSPPPSAPAEATDQAASARAHSASLFCPHCGGAINIRVSAGGSGGTSRSGPMDLEEFERAVGGGAPARPKGDDLLRQLDAALPAKDPGLRALEMGPASGPAAEPAAPPKARSRTPEPKRRQPPGDHRRRDRRR